MYVKNVRLAAHVVFNRVCSGESDDVENGRSINYVEDNKRIENWSSGRLKCFEARLLKIRKKLKLKLVLIRD